MSLKNLILAILLPACFVSFSSAATDSRELIQLREEAARLIPAYQGAREIKFEGDSANYGIVYYLSGGDWEDVKQFYRQNMSSTGWKFLEEQERGQPESCPDCPAQAQELTLELREAVLKFNQWGKTCEVVISLADKMDLSERFASEGVASDSEFALPAAGDIIIYVSVKK